MFRKIRAFLFSPSAVFSVAGIFVVGFFGGVIFWGGFNWTVEATNSESFCLSCHVMNTPYEEFQGSVHHTNVSGVGATCADCHVPRDWLPKMVRKAEATKELYHYIVGTIDTPEKYEERRLVMAQRVWDQMESNDSLECRACHNSDRFDYENMKPEAVAQKKEGFARGDTCITCHKGIAHKLPDMSSGYTRMHRDMVAMAERSSGSGDRLYPITTIAHYASAADAKTEENPIGQVLSATALEVLERDGDAIKVRMRGWRQEGADRVIYAKRGRRIFEATLSPAHTDRVEVGEGEVDPDTDLVWNRVSLDSWVRQGQVIEDVETIWAYAHQMNQAACGTCHAPRDRSHQTANQWIGVLRGKQESVALSSEEMRTLQKYMQLGARDVETEGGY